MLGVISKVFKLCIYGNFLCFA